MRGIRMLVITTTILLGKALLTLAAVAAWLWILVFIDHYLVLIDHYFQDQEQAPARVDIAFEKVWVPDGQTTDGISKAEAEGADIVGHYSYRAITTSFTLPW